MANRSSGGVRELRAMFEAANENHEITNSPASNRNSRSRSRSSRPDARDSSHDDATRRLRSPFRPLNTVRTNFVAVERAEPTHHFLATSTSMSNATTSGAQQSINQQPASTGSTATEQQPQNSSNLTRQSLEPSFISSTVPSPATANLPSTASPAAMASRTSTTTVSPRQKPSPNHRGPGTRLSKGPADLTSRSSPNHPQTSPATTSTTSQSLGHVLKGSPFEDTPKHQTPNKGSVASLPSPSSKLSPSTHTQSPSTLRTAQHRSSKPDSPRQIRDTTRPKDSPAVRSPDARYPSRPSLDGPASRSAGTGKTQSTPRTSLPSKTSPVVKSPRTAPNASSIISSGSVVRSPTSTASAIRSPASKAPASQSSPLTNKNTSTKAHSSIMPDDSPSHENSALRSTATAKASNEQDATASTLSRQGTKPQSSAQAVGKQRAAAPASISTAAKTTRASSAMVSARASSATSKKPTRVSSAGFRKPTPRSPTRPVELSSHLTAPTTSSAAKFDHSLHGDTNQNAATRTRDGPQRTSRVTSGASVHSRSSRSSLDPPKSARLSLQGPLPTRSFTTNAPHSAMPAIGRSKTQTAGPGAAKSTRSISDAPKSARPSLGPPPATQQAKDAGPRTATKTADSGFLARMMRPTTSSAGKVHGKSQHSPTNGHGLRSPIEGSKAPEEAHVNGAKKGRVSSFKEPKAPGVNGDVTKSSSTAVNGEAGESPANAESTAKGVEAQSAPAKSSLQHDVRGKEPIGQSQDKVEAITRGSKTPDTVDLQSPAKSPGSATGSSSDHHTPIKPSTDASTTSSGIVRDHAESKGPEPAHQASGDLDQNSPANGVVSAEKQTVPATNAPVSAAM